MDKSIKEGKITIVSLPYGLTQKALFNLKSLHNNENQLLKIAGNEYTLVAHLAKE